MYGTIFLKKLANVILWNLKWLKSNLIFRNLCELQINYF
jgi:hypothetical protein